MSKTRPRLRLWDEPPVVGRYDTGGTHGYRTEDHHLPLVQRNAEEAVTYYTSLFPGSKVTSVARWPEGGPGPAGQVLNMVFELAGQQFMALNGGPCYTFTPTISAADPVLRDHYRVAAARGHLHERAGNRDLAVIHYRKAADSTTSTAERHYLLLRAARLAEH